VKKLIITLTILLCCQGFLFSQDAGNKPAPTQSSVDETTLKLDAPVAGNTAAAGTENKAGGTNFLPVINTIIVLFLITVAIYGIVQWLKKNQEKKLTDSSLISVYAAKSLTATRGLNVVKVGAQWFFIGHSESGITLLSELKDKETIDFLTLSGPENSDQDKKSFSQLLSGFFQSKMGPADSSADFLSGQKDRLNKLK
jgi:flagellar biogenesis protein FliO